MQQLLRRTTMSEKERYKFAMILAGSNLLMTAIFAKLYPFVVFLDIFILKVLIIGLLYKLYKKSE